MDADTVIEKLLPYVVIVVVGSIAAAIYFLGSSLTIDAMIVLAGIAGGFLVSYFIYLSLSQEKTLEFAEGEEVILASTDPKTHVVLMSVGEHDFPLEPVKANIYLTNLGIICEPKGTGETAVFVPIEKITEFSPHQNGLRLRYVDVNIQYAEIVVYVDDRENWIQTIASMIGAKAY